MEYTELCNIAYKYGTDKCPQLKHTYTPVYYEMFKDKRDSVKKVLEMGIGTYESMEFLDQIYDKNLHRHYKKGASLKMWRDFFPNAQIYGADYVKEAMFEDERIKTFVCDETKEEDIKRLIENTGSDIDIFIDDGSHVWEHQVYLAKTILPLLKKDVIYIIEDVGWPDHIIEELKDYDCSIPRIPHREYGTNRGNKIPKDRLILVKNK